MKWDKQAKLKLYSVLRARLEQEGWINKGPAWRERDKILSFLGSFGIRSVQKIKKYSGPPWDPMRRESWVWCDPKTKETAAKQGRIIILDPYYSEEPTTKPWSPASGEGLSIPKDVAERFLVLGVP